MTAIQQAIKQRGLWATARQLRNLGVSFIDAYVGIFGVMPRRV